MDDFVSYLKNLPWKDWSVPIIGGVLALAGVIFTRHSERRQSHEDREETEKQSREAERTQSEAAQGQDLTARFKALMDGYEYRLRDVTTDLGSTRTELRNLRLEFSAHQTRCRLCPYLTGLEGSNAG